MQMIDPGSTGDNLNMEEIFRIKRNSHQPYHTLAESIEMNPYMQGSDHQNRFAFPNHQKHSNNDQNEGSSTRIYSQSEEFGNSADQNPRNGHHSDYRQTRTSTGTSNRQELKRKNQNQRPDHRQTKNAEANTGSSSQIFSLSTLNTLSRYALMALKPRTLPCLYRALCVGNRKAREMTESSRYWLPVWQWVSLGEQLNWELGQRWIVHCVKVMALCRPNYDDP